LPPRCGDAARRFRRRCPAVGDRLHHERAVRGNDLDRRRVRLYGHARPRRGGGISTGSVALRGGGKIVVNRYRPLTSVAHEIGHSLDLSHADTACGGGSSGEEADSTWADKWGLGYGITADVWDDGIPGDGRVNGAGNVGTAGSGDKASGAWYDFMSYCAVWRPESDSWISLQNYMRTFKALRSLQQIPWNTKRILQQLRSNETKTLQAEQRAVLPVIGYVEGDAVVVTRIRPKAGRPHVGPADSRYRLVLRDAVGRTLVETPMRVERSKGHGASMVFVSADVLLPGTAAGALPRALYAVEIVSGRRTLARVVRSPNAPTVELLAPKAGASIGGDPPVSIRWSARDADGGALTASVDYSTDDGASWRTVAGGLTVGRVSLPSRLLTASKRARVRIRVSDGLNETAAVSGRLVSLGAPPFVRITNPERRITISAVQPLSLAAQAYDDAFRRLRGRALSWFDGRRRIAFGESATVAPLAPGLHRISVVARDRLGRTARASVPVLVRGVAPRLIVRDAPARLSPRAGTLRVVLAATTPSLVTAAGPSLRGRSPRWRVGTTARAISVPVKPGRGAVHIVLRATAFGRASALQLTVLRSR